MGKKTPKLNYFLQLLLFKSFVGEDRRFGGEYSPPHPPVDETLYARIWEKGHNCSHYDVTYWPPPLSLASWVMTHHSYRLLSIVYFQQFPPPPSSLNDTTKMTNILEGLASVMNRSWGPDYKWSAGSCDNYYYYFVGRLSSPFSEVSL